MSESFGDWLSRQGRRVGDSLVNTWDNLHPGIKTILSFLPVVGDGAELTAQFYKMAVQNKQGDPVIMTLSGIGLMADLGNLTGVGAGFNVLLAGLKGAYQLMEPTARKGFQALMKECSKDPAKMGRMLETLTELAENPKLLSLFFNPHMGEHLVEVLNTAAFVGLKPASNLAENIYRTFYRQEIGSLQPENSPQTNRLLASSGNGVSQEQVLAIVDNYISQSNQQFNDQDRETIASIVSQQLGLSKGNLAGDIQENTSQNPISKAKAGIEMG
jgi:hypothetical protein